MKDKNYPHVTKDSKGNVNHFKGKSGYESWGEYDDRGNMIHFKETSGYECWYDYDKHNNMIHFKSKMTGYEWWREYHENGTESHYRNSYGAESWYDEKGMKISDPKLVKEVTFEEIAKAFGVDVSKIKIKQ